MTTASNLLDELARLQIFLTPDRGGSFRVRSPKGAMTAELRDRIRTQRVDLLLLLSACPDCGKSLDRRQGCCWKCGWRRCGCGKQTGSPFIATCIPCQYGRHDHQPERHP
jgi:hypothetical protein